MLGSNQQPQATTSNNKQQPSNKETIMVRIPREHLRSNQFCCFCEASLGNDRPHSAAPLKADICCDYCNQTVVTVARLWLAVGKPVFMVHNDGLFSGIANNMRSAEELCYDDVEVCIISQILHQVQGG